MHLLHPPGKDVILFTGNYGSGKTEVSVNVVSTLARAGRKVLIADLDLVNPYFRCREAKEPLEKLGVKIVAPEGAMHNADLPILLPEVRGAIIRSPGTTVLDVGGDNVGATVLASLTSVFQQVSHEMIFVLNQNRPFTDTVKGAMSLMDEIEKASKLKITALVGNTHLMDETTFDMVVEGARFTQAVGKERGLPVLYVSAPVTELKKHGYIDNTDVEPAITGLLQLQELSVPVLPLKRIMLPPWLGGPTPGSMATHARDGFGRLTNSGS